MNPTTLLRGPLDFCQSPMLNILATKTLESPSIDSLCNTTTTTTTTSTRATSALQTPSRRQLFDAAAPPASITNTNDQDSADSPPRALLPMGTQGVDSIFPPYSASKTGSSAPRMELLVQVAESSTNAAAAASEASAQQVQQKKKRQAPKPERKSIYRGVSWQKTSKAWVGQFKSNGKTTYLGLFANEAEAAKAYDLAVYVKSISAVAPATATAQPTQPQATSSSNQFNFGVPTAEEVAAFRANNNVPAGRLGASLSKRADMERRTDMRLARQSIESAPPAQAATAAIVVAEAQVVFPGAAATAATAPSSADQISDNEEEDLDEDEIAEVPQHVTAVVVPPPPPPKPSVARISDVSAKSERGATSHYRGVSWYAARQIWKASIQVNRKKEYIGRFNTEEEAARAYNARATQLRGSEAILNQVPDTYTRFPNGEEPPPPAPSSQQEGEAKSSAQPRRASLKAVKRASNADAGATAAKRQKSDSAAAAAAAPPPPPPPAPILAYGTPRASTRSGHHRFSESATLSTTFDRTLLDSEFDIFAGLTPACAMKQLPMSAVSTTGGGVGTNGGGLASTSHHHYALPPPGSELRLQSNAPNSVPRNNLHMLSITANYTPLAAMDSPSSATRAIPFTPSGMDTTSVRKMTPFS